MDCVDMNSFDRVTEVISAFSGIDQVPADILEKAADRGTRVHQQIENFFRQDCLIELDEDIKGYFESFMKWYNDNGYQLGHFKVLEQRFFDNDRMITGQSDLISVCPNRGTQIIDWKTSSRPQPKSWALQSAAYKTLAANNGYDDVGDVLFIQLKKDGKKPSLHKYDDYDQNMKMFDHCLSVYRHFDMKNRRKQ